MLQRSLLAALFLAITLATRAGESPLRLRDIRTLLPRLFVVYFASEINSMLFVVSKLYV